MTEAFESIMVKLMWMGLENKWEKPVKRAAPITPDILGDIKDVLNMENDTELVFWAACVMAFFVLARKSNLVPLVKFEANKQLACRYVKVFKDKVEITLQWTKT